MKARPRPGLLSYALLAFPLAFAGVPIYIHAPDYYARQGGLSLALIGLCLFLVRTLDALTDPLIGWWLDRHPARTRATAVLGSLLLVAGFALLFSPLGLDSAIWFAGCLILVTLGYSILSIQLNSLGALWLRRPAAQVRLTTLRESLGILGLIAAVVLPSLLANWIGESLAFLLTALLLALVTLPALWRLLAWINARPGLLRRQLASAMSSGPAAVPATFFWVYALAVLASAIPAVLVIFFVRDRLQLEPYTGLFLATYFLAGLIAMPAWRRLSAGFGHLVAWQCAMLLAIFSFSWAFTLSEGDLFAYFAVCLFSGMALGGELSLPAAWLSQKLHAGRAQDRANRYFALCSFLTKAALALAAGMLLPILQAWDFRPGQANSAQALGLLSVAYALLPGLLKGLALALSFCLRNAKGNRYEINAISGRSHRGQLSVL